MIARLPPPAVAAARALRRASRLRRRIQLTAVFLRGPGVRDPCVDVRRLRQPERCEMARGLCLSGWRATVSLSLSLSLSISLPLRRGAQPDYIASCVTPLRRVPLRRLRRQRCCDGCRAPLRGPEGASRPLGGFHPIIQRPAALSHSPIRDHARLLRLRQPGAREQAARAVEDGPSLSLSGWRATASFSQAGGPRSLSLSLWLEGHGLFLPRLEGHALSLSLSLSFSLFLSPISGWRAAAHGADGAGRVVQFVPPREEEEEEGGGGGGGG